jgi:GAF domain-containing protein
MNSSTSTLRFLQNENRRLREENESLREEVLALREYMKALRALHQATQTITAEQQLEPLLARILHAALRVMDAADGSLALLDESTGQLVFAVVLGELRTALQGYRIDQNMGIAGWVATHGEPVIVNNARQDGRFSPFVDDSFGFRTNALICVPLFVEGRVIGVIEVLNRFSGEDFTDTDLDLLTILASIAAVAIDKVHQEEVKARG